MVSTGVVGTNVEIYDFILYGAAAATVFGPVFFPHQDGLLAVFLALVTYAVGFAARPLGGLVFGHFGDRVGRKRLLVVSLVLMGSASVLIGLLPGYEQIRIAAPLLLTFLRLLQCFALGGRRPVAVAAAISCALWTIIFFPMVASHDPALVSLAVAVGLLLHGTMTGAQSVFYAELFGTSVRYSGVSVGYQAATVLAGAAAPLAGAALLQATHSAMPVTIMLVCCLALTVVGMSIVTETARSDLAS